MRSSSESINIAASAQKIDVDNRISLRFYYRIADNILKRADIFRGEKNIIDLYIMLLRFSSLVSETIPCHRDFRASPPSNKNFLKKRLLNAVIELEELKPAVKQKINELNRKDIYYVNNWNYDTRTGVTPSLELPPPTKQNLNNHGLTKTTLPIGKKFVKHTPNTQQHSYTKRPEEEFRRLSLNIRPKEETLSKHSILGPNGLRGQWQPPTSGKGVQYPSNIDLTPVEILRENILQDPVEDRLSNKKESISSEPQKSSAELILSSDNDDQTQITEEPNSLISFEPMETPLQTQTIRQPSPPPVLADVQDLIPTASPPVIKAECGMGNPTSDGLICSETPLQLHISTTLMDSFMRLAKSNTDKNLETCGVLAGSLKDRKFYITALIIPKQESTSDSCQTTNEEEIFEVQDKQSLFPLGWIHTHPTQSCFMSSIDVHTHYSYQIMLPEAIAIVMAPRDSSRKHGIFRLTNPGGMTVIRQCPQRGFHAHEPPSDGSPIYKQCTDVYMNPDLKVDVIDLR